MGTARDRKLPFTLGGLTGAAWLAQGLVNGHHLDVHWVGTVMLSFSAISWIAAIYVWSRVKTQSVYHIIALVMLVPFGILWAWIYLLFAAFRGLYSVDVESMTPRVEGVVTAPATNVAFPRTTGESLLNQLIGEDFSGVTFVRDYLQLQFNPPPLLNVYAPCSVYASGCSASFGDDSFANLMISQIGQSVVAVDGADNTLTISLTKGSRIVIPFGEGTFDGPEAFEFWGRDRDGESGPARHERPRFKFEL